MAKINSTIFKQETIQSWFSGVGTSVNNEVVQPFQNAEQVIWKYNQAIQHNSLTQQGWERLLAQSDDSLKAYLTSIKGSTASMTGYNVALQGNITGFKKVSSAITQYNALSASGAVEQNTFATAISTTNSRLGTYLTGLNGANASLGGYIISLVGATIKTVALKVATIALNSAVTMGASLIISGIVSAISEWINKTENMIEASEEAVEKIKSINEELKNNQKTISDTAKRYAELAQGVDQLTGKNISLSSEDYEEFLSLSNQLAEMFPTLTRNYNDNGDAIVQLSGDVDTIVGSLQNLIEAQRDLANRQIVDELPTVFDGVAAKSDAYEQELSTLESKRDALVKSLGDVQSEEFSTNFMDGFANKWIEISGDNLEVISQMRDDYIKILEDANIDYEELTPTYEMKDGVEVPVGFTIKINSSDEEVEKVKNTIDGKIEDLAKTYAKNIKTLNEEINTTNEKNKANWTSLSNSIYAWLSTDDSFKVMDDTMQATVQNIVNSLDWGSLDFSSWEDAKQYIQDNILSLFNTADGKEVLADIQVMFGIQTQFNNGDITVEQYQAKLQEFLASIESLPPESKKSIMLLFGIETNEDGTTTSSVDTMIANVEEKFEGADVNKLTLKDLEIAYSISSEEADKAIAEEKSKIKSELESLSKEGNVDLTIRPVIDSSAMQAAGWDVEDGSIATTFTQGEFIWQGDEENGQYVYVHYTPILPDGTVLTPDELTDYLYGTLEGSQSVLDADNKGIVLKVDTDLNIPEGDIKKFTNGEGSTDAIDGLIQKTGEWDDKVHGVQEQYYDTGEGIGYASNALDGLIEKHKQLENPDEITDLKTYLDSTIHAETKEKLLDLAKSGELTPETLSSTEEYNAILKDLQITAEDATNQILDMLTAQEKLSAASQGLDKLKSAYEEFKDEDIGFVTAETLESLPDAFKNLPEFDLFSQIVGDPTSGAQAIQQAFNDICRAYLFSQDTLQGLVGASDHEIQSYIANLKQMGISNSEELVNQTIAVLNEENELINAAEEEYYNAYLKYLESKDKSDLEYLENSASNNGQLVSALGSAYKSDYDNWCDLLAQKATAYNNFINALGGSYDSSKSVIQNMLDNGQNIGANSLVEAYTAQAEYNKIVQQAEQMKNALKLDYSPIETDFGTTYSPSTSSSSKDSSKDSTETFDWIENKLKAISNEIDTLDTKAGATWDTWANRNKALSQELGKVTDQIKIQEKAADKYLSLFNGVDISEAYRKKIMNGEMNIEEITNEELADKIKKAQEYWDNYITNKNDANEGRNTLASKVKEQFDNLKSESQANIDAIESQIDKLNDNMDIAETKGYYITEDYYNNLINKENDKISALTSQAKTLQDQLDSAVANGIKKGSEDWQSMKDEIDGVIDEINETKKSIIELQVEIAKTNFENIQTKAENFKNAIEHEIQIIESGMNLRETIGKKVSGDSYDSIELLSLSKKTNLEQEISDLYTGLKKFEVGTQNYEDALQEIREKEEELAQLEVDIAQNAIDRFNNEMEKASSYDRAEEVGLNHKISKQNTAMELKELNGQLVTSSDYDALNNYQKRMSNNLQDQYNQMVSALEEAISRGEIKIGDDNWIQAWEDIYAKEEEIAESNKTIAQNTKEGVSVDISNAQNGYDKIQNAYSHQSSMIQNIIDSIEAKGYKATQELYEGMILSAEQSISAYRSERNNLQNLLKNGLADGSIAIGDDNYWSITEALNEIDESILQADNDIIEFNNSINQLKWDSFDDLMSKITDITEEANFLNSLLDEDDLFDDNGNLTKEGLTSAAMHMTNIETYKSQADEYADEILKLNKQIARDPNNQTLLDRKNELVDIQRDLINSIQDEEDAIVSLAKNGYDKLKEALDDIIEKRKEALQTEQSLFEYQNTIDEKTSNIDNLKKQIEARYGDTSEEARADIQKLQVELNDAEKDLEETMYDKWVNDQEQMLDKFSSDIEEWINERLDDTNGILSEIRDAVTSSKSIDDVLKSLSDEWGFELSPEMLNILSSNSNIDVTSAIAEIKSISDMAEQSVNISNDVSQILNLLKSQTFSTASTASNQYGVSLKGYAVGSKRIPYNQLAITQEKGQELILSPSENGILTKLQKGDSVLTNEMTNRLWELAQGNIPFGVVQPQVNLPVVQRTNGDVVNIDNIGFEINLPHVENYDEFKEKLIRDSSFEKSMKAAILSKGFGRNSFEKLRC